MAKRIKGMATRSEEQETPPISETNFKKPSTCKLGCVRQRTVNLGDYNSVKIGYWIEREVLDSDENIKREYAEMIEILDDMISLDLAEID